MSEENRLQNNPMSINLLARIPFFTDLPSEELDRLVQEMEVVNLKSGEILFHEGD